MDRETPEQGQIGSYSKDPNQNQGHNQEDDNNDEEKKDKKGHAWNSECGRPK